MTDADLLILADHLHTEEGLRLRPYRDTVGKLTIGWGRNLTDNGISIDEATLLLRNDIARHVAELVRRQPFVLTLNHVRQIVLADMMFNLGGDGLMGFTAMWGQLRAHDYAGAARDMLNSKWAHQVGVRAQRLAAAMASGTFPKDTPA